jgi:IclR family pca regulon transcriptional regulator
VEQDHLQSLERGIALLRTFGSERPRQTVADAARATGFTRATARRILITLTRLGYARTDGRYFELTPKVLDIGYSFLASLNVGQIAQPFVEQLSECVDESVSVSVLDGTDVVYIARVPTKRIMTVSIGLGSRFPAFQTSMGRVLLAPLSDAEVVDIYERSDRRRVTEHTVASAAELLDRLADVRRDGWALVDQELEMGVRSIAAPIVDPQGRTVAALNIGTHAGRVDLDELNERFVPALITTSHDVSDAIARR